jgi:hypothetical protein
VTSRVVTLAGFGLLATVAVVLEVWARRSRHLCTFGEALTALLQNRAARLFLLAGWLWLGWHLFVRVEPG